MNANNDLIWLREKLKDMTEEEIIAAALAVYRVCLEERERIVHAATVLGKMTSPAKAAAARENGKRGGRPRKTSFLNQALNEGDGMYKP